MSSAKKHLAKFGRRKGPRAIHMPGKRSRLTQTYAEHGFKLYGYATHMIGMCVEFLSAIHIQACGGNCTLSVNHTSTVRHGASNPAFVNIRPEVINNLQGVSELVSLDLIVC